LEILAEDSDINKDLWLLIKQNCDSLDWRSSGNGMGTEKWC
jgi:hypothetical protein